MGREDCQKCEDLPLMIVTVAKLLSKEDKTPQCWTEIADIQHNYVFEEAYNQIYEVLFPCYNYLPQYLKMYFLCLGAMPPYSDFNLTYPTDRLSAKGFLEPIGNQNLKDFIFKYLVELAHKYHLVLLGI